MSISWISWLGLVMMAGSASLFWAVAGANFLIKYEWSDLILWPITPVIFVLGAFVLGLGMHW